MGDQRHLPCSGCDVDLMNVDAQAKPNPHFSGESVKEVPALVCPECGEKTAL